MCSGYQSFDRYMNYEYLLLYVEVKLISSSAHSRSISNDWARPCLRWVLGTEVPVMGPQPSKRPDLSSGRQTFRMRRK